MYVAKLKLLNKGLARHSKSTWNQVTEEEFGESLVMVDTGNKSERKCSLNVIIQLEEFKVVF